jgi:hypothetical protein
MSAGTPTQIVGSSYAVYNPGAINTSFTRIGISHDPTRPLTRPLSLLHLGYNSTLISNDGWRPWMDVGIYMAQETDNMYVGLWKEGNNFSDAIVSWGNDPAGAAGGPNHLKFIFTKQQGSTGAAGTYPGLEIARMWSDGIIGRTGFGDFLTLGIEPLNTVHINSPAADDQTIGGSSGLRFEDLTAGTPVTTNPGSGVLSVDTNGDVIYVDGGNGLGNLCSGTINPLIGNYEINNGGNNLNFTGSGITNFGDVPCGIITPGRVGIKNSFQIQPIKIALYVEQNGHPSSNIAGYFFANGIIGNTIIGVYAFAPVVGGAAPPTSVAILADGDVNITGTPYIANPAFVYSDQMFKTNIDTVVDALLIIDQLNPVTYEFDTSYSSRIAFQQGTQYGFVAQQVEQVVPELVNNGYLAPEFDSLGNEISPALNFKTMNYNGLFAILTKGIQEQNSIIDSLKAITQYQDSLNETLLVKNQEQDSILNSLQDQLNTLYGMVTDCCGNSNHSMQTNSGNNTQSTAQNVTLSDVQSIVLDQNVPNPFAEMTTITYTLPEGVSKAQLLFYDASGKLINSINLSSSAGKGQLNVFANDLSNGVYTYTLIVDGKIIDTKRMIKQ